MGSFLNLTNLFAPGMPFGMELAKTYDTFRSMFARKTPAPQTPGGLGQTLMSQRPPMTPEQAYPKQQRQPQQQEQNGSLLGNSLMYNPMMRRRYG